MRIGIIASPDNRITDYHLGNQLIRRFEVPVIFVETAGRRRGRRWWGKAARRIRTDGVAGIVSALRNCSYESARQRAFSQALTRHFIKLREHAAYDPGPEIIEVDDVHAAPVPQILKDRGITLLFQNGATIIRGCLIKLVRDGIVNVHHGYLPEIRGCHSIAWGLLENRPEWIGVSVHLIDEGIDTGPILKRQHLPVRPDSDYASLFCEATVLGGRLLVQAVRELAEGRAQIIPRSETGTYRPALTRRQWETLRSNRQFTPAP